MDEEIVGWKVRVDKLPLSLYSDIDVEFIDIFKKDAGENADKGKAKKWYSITLSRNYVSLVNRYKFGELWKYLLTLNYKNSKNLNYFALNRT